MNHVHEMKASTRGYSVRTEGTEVVGGGYPGRGSTTSLTSLPSRNTKRFFSTAKKQKSDLCSCGIKSPIHTVGFHEAVINGGAAI